MTPERLLEHFDRIADASGSVSSMRKLVVNLAVRGRLVEQFQSEAVAPAYLDKSRPTYLPTSWRLTSFEDVFDIQGGDQPPKSQFISEPKNGYVRLFQIRDLGSSPIPVYIPIDSTNRFCHDGEILIGRYGASVGKIFWAQEGAYNVALAKFIYPNDLYVARFAFLVLQSDYFQSGIVGASRSAQAGFNKVDLAKIQMPIAPLAEQSRIVAKVDELMTLCDRLEGAQRERESRRDRLAAASLQRLNQPVDGRRTDEFRDHVRFHLDHLSRVTTRPEHIPALRQTILNLAVRGQLVNDGNWPALPVPLSDAARLQNGYAFKSEWFTKTGVRLLRNTNVGHGAVQWDETVCIETQRAKEYERFDLRVGDIVLSLDRPFISTGTKVARISEADLPTLLLQRVGRFKFDESRLHPDYLFLWITSPHFNDQINPGRSNGVPHISSKQVESAFVYLPSISNQRHAVTEVTRLSAWCEQLDESFRSMQSVKCKLLQSLLHETIASSTQEVL